MRKNLLICIILAFPLGVGHAEPTKANSLKKVPASSGGWGLDSRYNKLLKEGLFQTFEGKVTKVRTFCPFDGMHDGVYLLLQTTREVVDIHLGPSWYVNHQDFRIQRGDHVTVKGARILFGDGSAVMAIEIVKGEEALQLRGTEGYPAWIAWKKKSSADAP